MRRSPAIRPCCVGSVGLALVALAVVASCRARHRVELADAGGPADVAPPTVPDAPIAEADSPPPRDVVVPLDPSSESVASDDRNVALVLTRGSALVTVPWSAPEPLRVDTPAGRVIVSSGEAHVAVADDGALRVFAREGAVTVWPVPQGARDDTAPRVMHATQLDARTTLLCTLAGVCTASRGARDADATVAWLARRNRDLARRPAQATLAAFTHAADADEADARAAHTMSRDATTTRTRDVAQAALSLALGRLHACLSRVEALGADDVAARRQRYTTLR